MGSQMLLKKCPVDVGFITETALHHVARMKPHMHSQRAESGVATPTRVTDVRAVRLRDCADCLAMLLRVRLHRMLPQMAALRKRLVADAARKPLPGDRDPCMILRHVIAELHLVDKRAATQMT